MSLTIWNRSLADARVGISRYNLALVQWELACGTILDYHHIWFGDQTHSTAAEAVAVPPVPELDLPKASDLNSAGRPSP